MISTESRSSLTTASSVARSRGLALVLLVRDEVRLGGADEPNREPCDRRDDAHVANRTHGLEDGRARLVLDDLDRERDSGDPDERAQRRSQRLDKALVPYAGGCARTPRAGARRSVARRRRGPPVARTTTNTCTTHDSRPTALRESGDRFGVAHGSGESHGADRQAAQRSGPGGGAQCARMTGIFAPIMIWRVAPPKMSCRSRLWV